MQHWFVYYKCPRPEAERLLPALRTLQQDIARKTGATSRLMRRADELSDQITLMEVYERIDDADEFGTQLRAAVDAAGFPPALAAARHVERFEDC